MLYKWNIYEISTKNSSINWVMFRWRIRKYCIEEWINVLVENTQDIKWRVRFALLDTEDIKPLEFYIKSIVKDSVIEIVLEGIPNPVLSKLKVNKEERYEL